MKLLAPPDPRRAEQAFVEYDPRYRALAAKSEKLSEARRALPAGSTRARVTSANARWARAAEARDLRAAELRAQFAAMPKPWEVTAAAWQREMESLAWDPSGASMPRNHHQAGNYILARLARKLFLRSFLPDRRNADGTPLEFPCPACHRDVVAQALAEGHAVPSEVLADYPELGALAHAEAVDAV